MLRGRKAQAEVERGEEGEHPRTVHVEQQIQQMRERQHGGRCWARSGRTPWESPIVFGK